MFHSKQTLETIYENSHSFVNFHKSFQVFVKHSLESVTKIHVHISKYALERNPINVAQMVNVYSKCLLDTTSDNSRSSMDFHMSFQVFVKPSPETVT